MNEDRHNAVKPASFDTARLDALLEDEGMCLDAIGVSRYLPVVVYQKGRPDNSADIGYQLESYKKQLGRGWNRAR